MAPADESRFRQPRRREELSWEAGTLLVEWEAKGRLDPGGEVLGCLFDWERRYVLEDLLWFGLGQADWGLAAACVGAGFSLLPEQGEGWIHEAMTFLSGRADVVAWLIAQGVGIERRGTWYSTPLILAAARPEQLGTLVVLLQHGAEIEASTIVDDDETALMVAASVDNRPAIRVLIDHGANVYRIQGYHGLGELGEDG